MRAQAAVVLLGHQKRICRDDIVRGAIVAHSVIGCRDAVYSAQVEVAALIGKILPQAEFIAQRALAQPRRMHVLGSL